MKLSRVAFALVALGLTTTLAAHAQPTPPPKIAPLSPASPALNAAPAQPTIKKVEGVRSPELRAKLKNVNTQLAPLVKADPGWPKYAAELEAAAKLTDKDLKLAEFKRLAEIGAAMRNRAITRATPQIRSLLKVEPPVKEPFPTFKKLTFPTEGTISSFPNLVEWKPSTSMAKRDIDNGQVKIWGIGSPTTSDSYLPLILGLAGTIKVPYGTKKLVATMRARVYGEVWATGAGVYAQAYASVGLMLRAANGKIVNGGDDNQARQRAKYAEVEHVGPNPIPVYMEKFDDQLEHQEFSVEWTVPPDVGTVEIAPFAAVSWDADMLGVCTAEAKVKAQEVKVYFVR